MEARLFLAPVVAAIAGGLCVAAVSMARRDALRPMGTRGVWAFVALLGGLALLFLSREGLISGVPSVELALHASGFLALIASAAACVRAGQLRARGEFLRVKSPLLVDEVLAGSREKPVRGVFRGRVLTTEPVTSPGGIVCAAYEAELRQLTRDGRRGALIGTERATPSLVQLEGENATVHVSFAATKWRSPVEIRRCGTLLTSGAIAGSGETTGGAEGDSGVEALSWERVLRLGEPVLVVGTLQRVGETKTPLLRGLRAGAAFVISAMDAEPAARALQQEARHYYAAALTAAAFAAFLLTR